MTEKRFDWDVCDGDALFYEDGAVIDYDDVVELLNAFNKENEQLKTFLETFKEELSLANRDNDTLEKENEQLQERNDRQAKQLDRLYQLISEKDWRTLSDIMDDFKKAEEQLQREWRTYE